MEWKRITYAELSVEVQVAAFTVSEGAAEYHLLLSGTDTCLPFAEQFRCINAAYARCTAEELADGAVAVFRRYFLSDATNQSDWVMDRECGHPRYALSVLQQAPLNGTKVALWAWLVAGVSVETRPGGLVSAKHGAYTHFWSAEDSNRSEGSESQTRLLLDEYARRLASQGCRLEHDCIRTWFFVRDVDVNYAGVVKARRELFKEHGLTEKTHFIASTGIEGRHADPSVKVLMDAYAVQGLSPGQIRYLYAPTHLNPTYEYGVTFERGTTVEYGDRKHIFLSGTASIDNRGAIVAPGDVRQQARRMMENIRVLLEEAGASWHDVMQAIVYLRDPSDTRVVSDFLATEYPCMPCILVHAPVCRTGWLCETECIAVVPASHNVYPPF